MGASTSARRRNDQIPPRPRPVAIAPPSSSPSPRPPPPPPPPVLPPQPPPIEVASYSSPTLPTPIQDASYPPPALPPPPYPPYVPNTSYARPPYPPNYYHYTPYPRYPGGYSVPAPTAGASNRAYYVNPGRGCTYDQFRPSYPFPPPPPPPTTSYVEQSKATTIKNDVNLNKETIRLEVDEQNPDHHLVAFTFDAAVDGSFTVFYMAKEGEECIFSPRDPDIYKPTTFRFQKGSGQKFCQPSGTGIDLGFFEVDELARPSFDETFPLVISAEVSMEDAASKPHAQITLAVLEKKESEKHFQVNVIKQILWIDGARYELRNIYGIASSSKTAVDEDAGKECVICMTEERTVTVLPCRHMCMCSACAEIFGRQSSRCPICRNPVEELMEIKV